MQQRAACVAATMMLSQHGCSPRSTGAVKRHRGKHLLNAFLVFLLVVVHASPTSAIYTAGPPVPLFGDGRGKPFFHFPQFGLYVQPEASQQKPTNQPIIVETSTTVATPRGDQVTRPTTILSRATEVVLYPESPTLPGYTTWPPTVTDPVRPTLQDQFQSMTSSSPMSVSQPVSALSTEYSSSSPSEPSFTVNSRALSFPTSSAIERLTTVADVPVATEPEDSKPFLLQPSMPNEPDNLLLPDERRPEESLLITPGMTPLKPAQNNVSDMPVAVQPTWTSRATTSAGPDANQTIHKVDLPPIVSTETDMLKWLVIAVAAAVVLVIVCVFVICLRSVDNRNNKKLRDFLYHTGAVCAGDEFDGPTNYMDIRPCSPLAKQWRSRGFSFGSQNHLNGGPSARATPTGTLKTSVHPQDAVQSRSRAGSAASSVLKKWRSRGKIHQEGSRWTDVPGPVFSASDLAHPGNAEPTCVCCTGESMVRGTQVAQPRIAACCDCREHNQCSCDCSYCANVPCHHRPDNYCSTVHMNPLHNVSLPAIPGQCGSARNSVFLPEEGMPHVGGHVAPASCQCSQVCSDHPPWQLPACQHFNPPAITVTSDVRNDPAANCCSCCSGTQHNHICRNEGQQFRVVPSREECTDHLISMLAQAHNLAKGMSLERRKPHGESSQAASQSNTSNASTLTHRPDFDESSGYIGSSPCAPSPHTTALHQILDPAVAHASPKPDEVAARLEECKQQQQLQQQQQQQQHGWSTFERQRQRTFPMVQAANAAKEKGRSGSSTPISNQLYGSLERQMDSLKPEQTVQGGHRNHRVVNQPSNSGPRPQPGSAPAQADRIVPSERDPCQMQNKHMAPNGDTVTQRDAKSSAPSLGPKPPPPPLPVRMKRGKQPEVLSSLPEQSIDIMRGQAAGHLDLQAQGTAPKSSSFWNVAKPAGDPSKQHKAIPQTRDLSSIRQGQRPADNRVSDMGAATATFTHVTTTAPARISNARPGLHKQHTASMLSQADSTTLSNPYNQFSWDYSSAMPGDMPFALPSAMAHREPWHNYDADAHNTLPQPGQNQAYLQHRLQDTIQQGSLKRPVASVNSLNAGHTPHKMDLSRQNTNSSSEEQNGNFYYVREGEPPLQPGDPYSDLPPLSDHVRRYLTGDSGLRKLSSMLSADSLDPSQTTTL